MARRLFWAEKLRMPVHSAPSRPFATCSAHDQSSGSDLTSQYAMALDAPFSPSLDAARRSHTVADPEDFVDLVQARGLPRLCECGIREGQEDGAHDDGCVSRQGSGHAR